MHTIISIVGKSGSGKTTLLERLVAELKSRGLKTAIVKHSHHANDLDTTAKDTWRFTKAGTELSAINSLDNLAIFRHIENFFDPSEISRYVTWDYDLILTEGFKSSHYPKIEVHRKELGPDLVTKPEQLLAVITDEPLHVQVPQFTSNDLPKIVDLIIAEMQKKQTQDDLEIMINGKHVNTDNALKDMVIPTLMAMLPLAETKENIKSLQISLRRK
jgi:molybdopterin-guanine dinucleotide biosynthesis protein MobB